MRRNEVFLGCGCRRFSPARRSNGGRVLARTMDRLQRYPVQVSSLRNLYETYGYAVELAVEITEVHCSDRFAAPVDVALLTVRPLGNVVDVVEGPDELFSEVVERVLVISGCLVVAVPENVVDRLVAFDCRGELGLEKSSHLTRSLATETDGGTSGSDALELRHWQRARDASGWRLETIFERKVGEDEMGLVSYQQVRLQCSLVSKSPVHQMIRSRRIAMGYCRIPQPQLEWEEAMLCQSRQFRRLRRRFPRRERL